MMVLPMMAQSADTPELQIELERLSNQTREQIARLQGVMPEGVAATNPRMCQDTWEMPDAPAHLQQALLVAAVQKMQHEKIALYNTTCLWAKQLELHDLEQPLALNLQQEEKSSQNLLQLVQKRTRLAA